MDLTVSPTSLFLCPRSKSLRKSCQFLVEAIAFRHSQPFFFLLIKPSFTDSYDSTNMQFLLLTDPYKLSPFRTTIRLNAIGASITETAGT